MSFMHVIGEWVFDPHSRYVSSDTAKHRLSPKASQVLLILLHEPGRVWTRTELLDAVWRNQTVGEEVLTQVIAELRRVLADDFRQPRYLETVHKTGYRFLPGVGERGAAARPGGWAADLEAYGVYLQGLAVREAGGRTGISAAIDLYATALSINPRLAIAHVGLGEAMLFIDYAETVEVSRVRGHCQAALRLDGSLAEAWSVDGVAAAHGGDFGAATELVGRSLALGLENPTVNYQAARICMAAMALRPAAEMLERAARLAPHDPSYRVLAAKVRHMLGDEPAAERNYAAALPRLDAQLAEHPDDFRARLGRARALEALGRSDDAAVDMTLAAAHPEPMPFNLACTLAQHGRTERALDALERAVDGGWRGAWAGTWLDHDSDFHALRGARRFDRIAAQARLVS